MYSTNIHKAAEIVIGKDIEKLKSKQGHIVVRVSPGGKEYFIYVLNDDNAKRKIKKIVGPYVCSNID